ncbi:UNVERIFIED_CONTAM: hypothetical protein HDU68_001339 [Siphonaria sp. JEL0065]|nr:hypothetical protein HDU68_001339 [Siphonaria sp. JEL0065]
MVHPLYHQTLLPGQQFPLITLPVVGHSEPQPLFSANEATRTKLIVIYRGSFCPYCQKQINHLKQTLAKLNDADIDIVIASADLAPAAEKFAQDFEIPFPVAHSLELDQMKELGVYVSSPTDYIDQEHVFSEPAWFLVEADGRIKYLEYASAPFGGRVDVDVLGRIYTWAREKGRNVIWGQEV